MCLSASENTDERSSSSDKYHINKKISTMLLRELFEAPSVILGPDGKPFDTDNQKPSPKPTSDPKELEKQVLEKNKTSGFAKAKSIGGTMGAGMSWLSRAGLAVLFYDYWTTVSAAEESLKNNEITQQNFDAIRQWKIGELILAFSSKYIAKIPASLFFNLPIKTAGLAVKGSAAVIATAPSLISATAKGTGKGLGLVGKIFGKTRVGRGLQVISKGAEKVGDVLGIGGNKIKLAGDRAFTIAQSGDVLVDFASESFRAWFTIWIQTDAGKKFFSEKLPEVIQYPGRWYEIFETIAVNLFDMYVKDSVEQDKKEPAAKPEAEPEKPSAPPAKNSGVTNLPGVPGDFTGTIKF